MRPVCLGVHIWWMSIASLLLRIISYYSYSIQISYCSYLHILDDTIYYIDRKQSMAQTSPLLHIRHKGIWCWLVQDKVPHFRWLTAELLSNLRLFFCFLHGYLLWRRYWANENLTTSWVFKFDAKSSVESSCHNGAFSFSRKIPITAQSISWYTHIF